MKNKKIISDIRIFKSNFKNIDGNPRPVSVYNKSLNIAVRRLTMKLRENNFILGDFDHLYVNFTTCEVLNGCNLAERSVDSIMSWYRYYDFHVNENEFEEMLKKDDSEYFLHNIAHILITCFANLEESKKIVEISTEAALIENEQMLMKFKESKLGDVTAIIYLRLLNDGILYPLIRVIDTENNVILNKDLPKTQDFNQFGQILLSRKKVIIKPRKNVFSKDLEPIIFYL